MEHNNNNTKENGTEKQQCSPTGVSGGGGIMEQIISLLPVTIPGFSEKPSVKDDNKEEPEENKKPEPEGTSPLPITLPDSGLNPEEASILMSIVHD